MRKAMDPKQDNIFNRQEKGKGLISSIRGDIFWSFQKTQGLLNCTTKDINCILEEQIGNKNKLVITLKSRHGNIPIVNNTELPTFQ